MKNTLTIIQIVLSVLLILVILLQAQGQGLGALGGGSGASFKTKRGVEKILFRATILLALAFLISLMAQLLVA